MSRIESEAQAEEMMEFFTGRSGSHNATLYYTDSKDAKYLQYLKKFDKIVSKCKQATTVVLGEVVARSAIS